MKKRYAVFAICLCAWCMGYLSDAFGAPSVKRLGGANTYSGLGGAVSAKTSDSGVTTKTTAVPRAASSRVNRLTSVKAMPVAKTISSSGVSDTSRLSVGKYLHNAGVSAGVIKPVSGSSVTSAEMEDLTGRVSVLEEQIETKADSDNYYTKQEIDDKNYITQADIQNSYSTSEQIANEYASKTEVTTMSNTVSGLGTSVSALETRVVAIEDALGAGDNLANDWEQQGLVFE